MDKDSEPIIEVADEYDSLKSTVNALHTNSYSAVSFYEKNHFAKLTPVPQFDVWPMYKTLWY